MPLSRLISCVANFELPKNDAETLLCHFSNNKIGNFIIFAPVLSVVAELLNHMSMSDLMKLVCVGGVKKLSKPGGGSDLNLNKIAECINSLDAPNEDCKALVHAAAIRYDKILMNDKIDSVFPSFSRDFSPSQKWCFLIDNFYTICFPGLIHWHNAELQDYKGLITESMCNILTFIKHFHCTDNSEHCSQDSGKLCMLYTTRDCTTLCKTPTRVWRLFATRKNLPINIRAISFINAVWREFYPIAGCHRYGKSIFAVVCRLLQCCSGKNLRR